MALHGKSALNEWVQRNGKEHPNYETIVTAAVPVMQFRSVVLVDGASYQGDVCYQKRAAEESAAQTAFEAIGKRVHTLSSLKPKTSPSILKPKSSPIVSPPAIPKKKTPKAVDDPTRRVLAYIDMDQNQKAHLLFSQLERNERMRVVGVYSQITAIPDGEWGPLERKCLKSTCANATDMWITMEIGRRLSSKKRYAKIYIVTKDNFAMSVALVVAEDFKRKGVKVKRLVNVLQLMQKYTSA